MVVYVIISITASGIGPNASLAVDPVGVYSTIEKALDYINELEKYTKKEYYTESETVFDIFEYNLDEEPAFLDYLKKREQERMDEISTMMIDLMAKGYIDQLVGEDGYFYYTLTEQGKEIAKKIPSQVKKFFKKRKDSP
jgi:hypothetical protein